ncbi:putative radical SAM protein YgiQ [Dysgonomonas sp. PH5-45]|uniref:YgiQ family radical SAM protein n=1 Tax=unclassified Dysgonomonas TaxID=2630389 RepID=UPI002473F779|nr:MULTISPECIES: YgiQ family radical SAM protein [unclassified Dysgonomonas]MDH6355342.1 putative radical SAM protein YgiQ [Dysgonomonas sp. PH5-45]MDH6388240.1 putative radical SAM protein YgiQ [Dysgonomonas sp. PH5-37]
MKEYRLTDWLPTTKKEIELRGWDELDVILFSGDAYVDHPSFGAAVIGRMLEAEGLRVAIVPQPNWRDDLRDFRKLGKPRLFFGVTAGAMDSMINHYTANKRLRSDDAYTPDSRADMRPDRPSVVYTNILKDIYPDVPVVLGGIEASLRRVTHYDYWEDKLLKSILVNSKADLLVYGMGEKPLKAIVDSLRAGTAFSQLRSIPQTSYLTTKQDIAPYGENEKDILLYPHEECLTDKVKQAKNFRVVEEQSNMLLAQRIVQECDGKLVVINPPYRPMTEKEIDASFDLPYTRLPHPKYKGKHIPAFEMIKFSVNMHRGCFGGCAFCTISAHQGKFIASRSKRSILNEVKQITHMPDFKGYLSDLGGPSANMYAMRGKDEAVCMKCRRPSCIHPSICRNLNVDHSSLLDVYKSVDALPGIKKSFVGSGIRYDMMLHRNEDEKLNKASAAYTTELIKNHVSGRLKVAPEHTSAKVLDYMRKPVFEQFYQFKRIFDDVNKKNGLRQQLIPYFISSHPGCTEADMAELAAITKGMGFNLEQVQDFTPSPMTLATEIYYTGIHPYTLKKVYTARTKEQKLAQRQFFFWHKKENKQQIIKTLRKIKREDLIKKLYG